MNNIEFIRQEIINMKNLAEAELKDHRESYGEHDDLPSWIDGRLVGAVKSFDYVLHIISLFDE